MGLLSSSKSKHRMCNRREEKRGSKDLERDGGGTSLSLRHRWRREFISGWDGCKTDFEYDWAIAVVVEPGSP